MEAKELLQDLEEYQQEGDTGYVNNASRFGYGYDIDKEAVREQFGEFKYELTNHRLDSGDHDTVLTVIYFKDHDLRVGIYGYYSSHNGSDFDEGFCIVEPKQVTVTKYEVVK